MVTTKLAGLLLCALVVLAAVPEHAEAATTGSQRDASHNIPRPPSAVVSPANQKYGGVLVAAQPTDPPSCDLASGVGLSFLAAQVCAPMLNGLVTFDPLAPASFSIIPDLAQSWELTADLKTWVFRLRPGVKWHNGAALSASDAAFSLNRIVTPPTGVSRNLVATELAGYINTVEALDALTVRVTTKAPTPAPFLAYMASVHSSIYPKAVTEALSPPTMSNPSQVVGTGPFKFQQGVLGISWEMQKNINYFVPGRPFLDGFRMVVISDPATRIAAFRTKQVRVIPHQDSGLHGMTGAELELVKQDLPDQKTVHKTPSLLAVTLEMNLGQPLFAHARVRKAVSLALSRPEAVAALGGGSVGAFMRPGGPWAFTSTELAARSGYKDKVLERQMAKQLLAEAGFPNGFLTTLTTRGSPSDFVTAAEFISAQLQTVGIQVPILQMDVAPFLAGLNNRQFAMVVNAVLFQLDDPDTVLGRQFRCNASPITNFPGFCDSQGVEALLDSVSQTMDPALRLSKVREVQAQLLERFDLGGNPKVVLLWAERRVPIWNDVGPYLPSPSLSESNRWQEVSLEFTPEPPPPPPPTPIPAITPWALGALAGAFLFLTAWALRQRPTRPLGE